MSITVSEFDLIHNRTHYFSDLEFSSIKQLVTYYQITNTEEGEENRQLSNFSVTFDKDKMHELFYKRGICQFGTI